MHEPGQHCFGATDHSRSKVLSHRLLLQRIWSPEYGAEAEYLRVYINRLRHKLEHDPAHPHYLLTEPGVGYRFVAPGIE